MEQLSFHYKAHRPIEKPVHVGVVGSGDLEILIEPYAGETAEVQIRTQLAGLADTWNALLERFFQEHPIAATIQINDFGATPGVVTLRLAQAIEGLDA